MLKQNSLLAQLVCLIENCDKTQITLVTLRSLWQWKLNSSSSVLYNIKAKPEKHILPHKNFLYCKSFRSRQQKNFRPDMKM